MVDFTKGLISAIELTEILDVTIQGVYKLISTNNIETISVNARKKVCSPSGVRKLLESRGYKYPDQNISIQIVKGGVGKTGLSFCLGVRASHYGAKVLLVDLDQQGNLTSSFSIDSRDKPVWLNLIRKEVTVEEAVIKLSDNLSIIPSSLNNSRLDTELTQSLSNLKDLIKDILEPIRDQFDLVIFDCPPAINKIVAAATCASDRVIIPINPDPYALDGLEFTLAELKSIKSNFKIDFDHQIIWNNYDARQRLGSFYMHELTKDEDRINHIFPVVIRTDTNLKNSVFAAKSIFEETRKTAIKEDIDQFTREVLGINAWSEANRA